MKIPKGNFFLFLKKEKGTCVIIFKFPKANNPNDKTAPIYVVVPISFISDIHVGQVGILDRDIFLRPIVANYQIRNGQYGHIYFEVY